LITFYYDWRYFDRFLNHDFRNLIHVLGSCHVSYFSRFVILLNLVNPILLSSNPTPNRLTQNKSIYINLVISYLPHTTSTFLAKQLLSTQQNIGIKMKRFIITLKSRFLLKQSLILGFLRCLCPWQWRTFYLQKKAIVSLIFLEIFWFCIILLPFS